MRPKFIRNSLDLTIARLPNLRYGRYEPNTMESIQFHYKNRGSASVTPVNNNAFDSQQLGSVDVDSIMMSFRNHEPPNNLSGELQFDATKEYQAAQKKSRFFNSGAKADEFNSPNCPIRPSAFHCSSQNQLQASKKSKNLKIQIFKFFNFLAKI